MDRVMCGEGSLPCWFWPLGLLFLFLPTIVQSISIFSGRVDGWRAMDTKYKILLGPLYILGAPGLAIKLTGETFCCGETRGEDAMMDWLAYCKLAEVLFEAVPQVTILLPLPISRIPGVLKLRIPVDEGFAMAPHRQRLQLGRVLQCHHLNYHDPVRHCHWTQGRRKHTWLLQGRGKPERWSEENALLTMLMYSS